MKRGHPRGCGVCKCLGRVKDQVKLGNRERYCRQGSSEARHNLLWLALSDVDSVVVAHGWHWLLSKGVYDTYSERLVGHRLDFFRRCPLEA